MCEKYNGWSNYPTWVYNLWQDNDEYNYNYVRELVNEVKEEIESSFIEDDITTFENKFNYELQERLKDEFENNNPLIDNANVYSDLIGWAIGHINWYEISNHLMDEGE